ncbi:tetratricopeptide repeat protein [Clostridium massiliamazoniense]|uniref:tetratricopeptide repeat protein n=1 Tax=Clostridium massiliamazoniense TaxID=1347366 RepID=UPI0006D825FD|nr:tetratricopeptide repeat protein [Clostridium massiliamazoniense]
MDISNKKLKKAYTFYQTGRLKEALSLCEKILEKESCDEDALELEGKILKDLGRLEEAIITWKINAEYNDNEDAKNSLASVDEEKKQHTLSYENLSQLISEAANNDNNDIQNNFIDSPKVEVEVEISSTTRVKEEVETPTVDEKVEEPKVEKVKDNSAEIKVTSTSKKVTDSNKNKNLNSKTTTVEKTNSKPIEEFNPQNYGTATKKSSKKLLYSTAGVIIIIIAIIAAIYASTSANHKKSTTPQVENSQSKETPKTDTTNKTPAPEVAKPAQLTDEQGQALINELTTLAESNSIDGVNKLLQENPISVIPEKYVSDYNNAVGFMETQGVNYYYEKEISAYNNKNYQEVINYFNSAKPYYKNFKAAPTMLFYAASSYSALNQKENAMNAYKEYLKEFPNSEYYTQECLYNLAMYYNQTNDLTQAKQYASELANKFPTSMYNNTNIENILKK